MKFSKYSKGPPPAILQATSAYLRSLSLSGPSLSAPAISNSSYSDFHSFDRTKPMHETIPFYFAEASDEAHLSDPLRQGDSMKKKTGNKINRRYKDRLFYALFGSEERKRLTLELYNAINQTDYDNPDDLQLNTI